MNDLISVIIPVYNVEKYLEECVLSVINQTYSNLEIILVDDGSTDGSGLLCDQYKDRDSRIKVIHKKNGGLSDARNVALEICNGQYISFVDSDDYVSEAFIEIMYQAIIDNDCQMSAVHGGIDFWDERSNRPHLASSLDECNIKVFNSKNALELML